MSPQLAVRVKILTIFLAAMTILVIHATLSLAIQFGRIIFMDMSQVSEPVREVRNESMSAIPSVVMSLLMMILRLAMGWTFVNRLEIKFLIVYLIALFVKIGDSIPLTVSLSHIIFNTLLYGFEASLIVSIMHEL